MNLMRMLAGCIVAMSLVSSAGATPVPAVAIDPRTQVGDPPGPGQYRGYNAGNLNGIRGWSFQVLETASITNLAWYDEDGGGLSHSHRVGIFHNLDPITWELVAETEIPEGSLAPLLGPWRLSSVSTTLTPGRYFISGLDNAQSMDVVKFVSGESGFTIDPRLDEVTVPGFRSDAEFGPPELYLLAPGLFLGPMFFIEPVPEPNTLALFAIGALLVGARAARRRPASQT